MTTLHTRMRRAAAVAVVSLALLGGCQDSQDDPAPSATPTAADGAYCGLLSTELVDSLLGDDPKVEGDLVTEASETGTVECNVTGDTDGVSYVNASLDPDTGKPSPTEVDTEGCQAVEVDGWGPVTTCPRDEWVLLSAYPPEDSRFISVSVRLDEAGAQLEATDEQLQRMADAAVRVAQDLNTNYNRF